MAEPKPQIHRQTEHGTWTPARPLGFQGTGLDFEVTGSRPWQWAAYSRHGVVATGKARTRLGLAAALRWAALKSRITYRALGQRADGEQTGGGRD